MRVDLNCDLGESFGRYTLGLDDKVIPLVSSCNIACGMHAGDPMVMQRTVKLAAQSGVAVGAHPGYPDLQGFGRRDLNLSPDEAYSFLLYQIGALSAFCAANGTRLHHVKPHGQLYNRCAVDGPFAQAVAAAVHDFDDELVLVGLAGSKLIRAGHDAGLQTAGEFFADRNYTEDGTLVNRREWNALITDEKAAIERLCKVIRNGAVKTITGKVIPMKADTICVHGDNEHALEFISLCRERLGEAGIDIKPVGAE